MNDELTDNQLTNLEKQFLAIAIQGVCVRQGPVIFPVAISVAQKLNLEDQLKGMLKSWIQFSQSPNSTTGSIPGKEPTV